MANPELPKKITFDISILSLFKLSVLFLIIFFIFFIRDVILIIFVALILASALDPFVDFMQKHKIPRGFGILIIYLFIILVLVGAVYLIIPPISTEVKGLTDDFPAYWEKLSGNIESLRTYSDSHGWTDNIQKSLNDLQSNVNAIQAAAGGIFSTFFAFLGGIISILIVAVLTFYLTIEEHGMKRVLRSLVPVKYQPYVTHLVNRIQEKIGMWFRGQLVLSLIIFVLCWFGLTILGIKYALVLALFAGVTELIPYIGPFIGAIPAIFIALTQSPALVVGVLIIYVIIQQLENNIIVPKVMQKAVGLNPIITIIAMMIGFKLAGVLGIVIAVPVATAMSIALNDVLEIKEE
ncbi:MAG: AI-2E family transporter [Candidatus Buchananbacteria bacterium]|nr:AI-2E family transporter [Candidatus Buchananbacteria bacterium]